MTAGNDLLTIFHTVRYLKPVQVYRRVWRRRPSRSLAIVPQRRPVVREWTPAIARESAATGPFRFRFLNQEREPAGWNDSSIPKLWLYNLHYFEAPEPGLMRRWVAENPPGHGNGWEPYPLSLRIANWIKWTLSGGRLDAECLASLAVQAARLSGSLEYHLLANHLFANAKALVFAGLFFQAEPWLRLGTEILGRQIPEQVLSDGGHFERSPMYHSLILEDLLDLVNLYRTYGLPAPQSWMHAAGRMLGWLGQMCHPDGQIAFFNDAAFDVAPAPEALFEYARRLGVELRTLPLGESGYRRLENRSTVVLFDAAPIGPDFQPGHAHADTLSFELSHRGRRVIVNSGTSTYETGPERLRQRGTAAHSTVVVDGLDQSEVWSAFRVARRARPLEVVTGHDAAAVEASHDGYRRLPDPVTHRRALRLTPAGLLVIDRLTGTREHTADLCFHLHPEAEAELRLDPRLARQDRPGTFHPRFNSSIPNRVVVGRYRGPLPVTLETLVLLPAAGAPHRTVRAEQPAAV